TRFSSGPAIALMKSWGATRRNCPCGRTRRTAPFWEELRRTRSIRERECRVRNRHDKIFTELLSADIIEINGVAHLLTVGLDISQRKQTEAELRASEVRLRESEARFSAAFHASPAFISIVRMSDAQYVLANDVFLSFLG